MHKTISDKYLIFNLYNSVLEKGGFYDFDKNNMEGHMIL